MEWMPAFVLVLVSRWAVDHEFIDHRESTYHFVRPSRVLDDMEFLRGRIVDLLYAPADADGFRLPDREYSYAAVQLNREYKAWLEIQQFVYPHRFDEFKEAITACDRLYEVWDMIRDARCEYYYIAVRRMAMKRLREAIGPEAYYSGNWPAPVPTRYFRQVP